MIVTAKNRIPFLWQLTIAAPWGTLRFKYMVIGAVFIFSLKKFIENPAGITFIMSIPFILSLAVNPVASFMSDRIWTKWGRRKPFVVPSMIGVTLAFIMMPLAPNMWVLLFAYFLYQVSHDYGLGATDTIKQEVVPPHQRGTAAAIGTWLQNIANLGFYLVAVGRFDDYKFYAGFPITGEESIYWGIAAAILMMSLLMMLGVKEVKQPSKYLGEKFTLRNFFGGLSNRNLWPVYLLITGFSVANAGLGALGALLYTEQWGFTKQEMGINIAVGSTLNIFLIVLIGLFADKLPRMKSFKLLLFISIFIELCFYIYVEFILFDKTPSLPEVIFFGEMASVAGILLGMLYMPLVYDYIPRNEMGTFSAGSVLVGKIIAIITLNGVGVFVALYSSFFMPPGGDMIRLTTSEPMNPPAIRELIHSENSDPDLTPEDLSIETWFATNAQFEEGHAFEIRRENPETVELNKKIKKINESLKKILAKKGNAEVAAERATLIGDTDTVEKEMAKAATYSEEAQPLEDEIAELKAEQLAQAELFSTKVIDLLGDHLMESGAQVQAAATEPVTLFTYNMQARPKSARANRTLIQLRLLRDDVIDMKLSNEGLDFFITISVTGDHSGDAQFLAALTQDLSTAAESRIDEYLPEELTLYGSPVVEESVSLQLKVIEDPINNYISPLTKVVYAVRDVFTDIPPIERRLWASARALRDLNLSHVVGAWDASSGNQHSVRLQAVYQEDAQSTGTTKDNLSADEVTALARIENLLAGESPTAIQNAQDLYLRSLPAFAQNRITVPTPILERRFATPKYDYMSGYLWMVVMSSIGLLICLLFTRREEKGLIHKRGREESENEEQAEEARAKAAAESTEEPVAIETYTPGYVPQKIGMVLLGLAFIVLALVQLVPQFNLLLNGESTTAFASKIVKERPGGISTELKSDAAVGDNLESYDRSYVFWTYFQFKSNDGVLHEYRPLTGKQLAPEYSLLDKDGLPTTELLYYDPENPENVLLPLQYSTWFLSGLLLLFGVIGTIFGIILLYYAKKPIELPIILPVDTPKAE